MNMTMKECLEDIKTTDRKQYLEEVRDHGIYNIRNEPIDINTDEEYDSFHAECKDAVEKRLAEMEEKELELAL